MTQAKQSRPAFLLDGGVPEGWTRVTHTTNGDRYTDSQRIYHGYGLEIVCSITIARDGSRWLHVSYSRAAVIPDWNDTKLVKELFVGRDRKAIQVLPCEEEYVNIHPTCLHLWSPVDSDPVPDLRNEDGCL